MNQDSSRGDLFDQAPEAYAAARPGYPAELYEVLENVCGLSAGSRVLEIGAGTGQATLPLLERGALVTAIEPGAALAKLLQQNVPTLPLEVIVSPFEDAPLPEGAFDLVVSATAFHWVNTAAGLRKAGSALRDGGWLALWWNVLADPTRADPFHEALEPILRVRAPQLIEEGSHGSVYALDVAARAAEIDDSGLFGPVSQYLFPWQGRHSPENLRSLFSTFSPWLALPAPLRESMLDVVADLVRVEFRGLVVRPYQTVLYLAQRQG